MPSRVAWRGFDGPRCRPLTEAEERALTARYRRTGEPGLERELVERNVRLVIKLAGEHHRSGGAALDDLIQEGIVGLIEAVRRFDPGKGVRLCTYARFWIRAYIMKHVMDNVRLVRVVRTRAQRAAFHKGLVWAADASLDSAGPNDERPMGDRMADPAPPADTLVETAELAWRVRRAAADLGGRLGPRDAMILERRVLADEPEPRDRIARRVSLSGERVRQIEATLCATLRGHLETATAGVAA